MSNLIFRRFLKTKDVEWFKIAIQDDDFVCDVLVIDTRRPSTVADYPNLKQPIDKFDLELIENPNLVKGLFFFREREPGENVLQELNCLFDSLLLHLVHDWVFDIKILKIKKKGKLSKEKKDEYYHNCVCEYLFKDFGFTQKALDRFKNPTFHFLTQEKTWSKAWEKKYKIKFH